MENNNVDAIRRSDLWKISKSPMHFRYWMDHEKERTKALIFGAAAHKYILQPREFNDEYAVAPMINRKTKEGRERYASFIDDAEGRDVITQDDFATIKDMRDVLMMDPVIEELLSGEYEKPFTWTDDLTGELCTCRVDCLSEYCDEKYIVDYKTTESCADGVFERSVRKYGYKFQAGMYHEGVFQTLFEDRKFAFIAQEKEPPYAARIYFCTDEFVRQGYDQFRELIGIYHKCKESGNWPGYGIGELLEDS